MVWSLGHCGQRTSVKCAEAAWNYKAGGIVHLKSPAFFCFVLFCFFVCLFFFITIHWYSLNVKRVKWLLFKRVKSVRTTLTEWKSLSKRVKIIPKRVKITPKRVRITPKEWLSLFGGAHWGTALLFRAVPQWVRVVLTLFTLLKSNHFTLFTLRE